MPGTENYLTRNAFPQAAVTKQHTVWGLHSRDVLSCSSGGQKAETKMFMGLVPFVSSEEKHIPWLSPGFWMVCWSPLTFLDS